MESLTGVMVQSAFSVQVTRKALDAASQIALQLLDGLPRLDQAAGSGSGPIYSPSGGLTSPTATVKGHNLDTTA